MGAITDDAAPQPASGNEVRQRRSRDRTRKALARVADSLLRLRHDVGLIWTESCENRNETLAAISDISTALKHAAAVSRRRERMILAGFAVAAGLLVLVEVMKYRDESDLWRMMNTIVGHISDGSFTDGEKTYSVTVERTSTSTCREFVGSEVYSMDRPASSQEIFRVRVPEGCKTLEPVLTQPPE